MPEEPVTEICRIEEQVPHPDRKISRMILSRVNGWWTFTGLDQKVGDYVLYVPPETIIPPALEAIWLKGSKFGLNKGRVRAINFKGAVSMGLPVTIQDIGLAYEVLGKVPPKSFRLGQNLASDLELKKYEEPIKEEVIQGPGKKRKRRKTWSHPDFKEYTRILHLRNQTHLFEDGEQVYVSEKRHGCNARAGWLRALPRTRLQKFIEYFKVLLASILPIHWEEKWEFVYGSHFQQCSDNPNGSKHWFSGTVGDVYKDQLTKYKDRLGLGMELFGEIIGPGVQKGYSYGDEVRFEAFDILENGEYLSPQDFLAYCKKKDIPTVPVLYWGPYDLKVLEGLSSGPSVTESQPIKEGIVVKPVKERTSHVGRVILKMINKDYYTQDPEEQTEYH